MNRKLTLLLGLVAVLVAAVAVPALGADTNITPQVSQELSVRALAKARLALLTARSAKSQSRVAVRTAEAAMNAAGKAVGPPGAPGPVGPSGPAGPPGPAGVSSPPVQSDLAAGAVTTASGTFQQLAGGPKLSVDVPASGLIEVWAQATVSEGGAVSLFEDGQQMPGQNESALCTTEAAGGILFAAFAPGPPEGALTVGTPSADFCGTVGAPGPVLFQTTPGSHIYELRYSIGCGCEPEATFSGRSLRIAPRL